MKKRIYSDGIASRMKTIRSEKNLTTKEMAAQLGLDQNNYRKYERGLYCPPIHIQLLLAQRFDISLDWLILNKGPMYFNKIESALQENEQRKLVETKEAIPPDAMIITAQEIKDLIRFMEDNPLHKFQLLAHFYNYKEEVQKTGKISIEDNKQS